MVVVVVEEVRFCRGGGRTPTECIHSVGLHVRQHGRSRGGIESPRPWTLLLLEFVVVFAITGKMGRYFTQGPCIWPSRHAARMHRCCARDLVVRNSMRRRPAPSPRRPSTCVGRGDVRLFCHLVGLCAPHLSQGPSSPKLPPLSPRFLSSRLFASYLPSPWLLPMGRPVTDQAVARLQAIVGPTYASSDLRAALFRSQGDENRALDRLLSAPPRTPSRGGARRKGGGLSARRPVATVAATPPRSSPPSRAAATSSISSLPPLPPVRAVDASVLATAAASAAKSSSDPASGATAANGHSLGAPSSLSKTTASHSAPGTTDEAGPFSSATLSTLATPAVTPASTPGATPAATPAASSTTAASTRAADCPSATPTPAAATATDGASSPSTDDAVARAAWHAFFRHYYASAYKRVAASAAEAANTGGVTAPSAPVDRKSVNKLLARWWRTLPAADQRPWLAAAAGVVVGDAGGGDERGCNANGTSATGATPAVGTGGDAEAGDTTGDGAAAPSTVAAATPPPSASAAAAMDVTGNALEATTAASGMACPAAATPAATASASTSACPLRSHSEPAAGAAAGVSSVPFFPSFLPAPVPGATRSDAWPKNLADAAVTCMCTSSARSMAAGDAVILSVGSLEHAGRAPTKHARERSAAGRRAGGRSGTPTPPLPSTSAPPTKVPPLPPASAMAIVRFMHRGSAVGKLPAAIAQPLGLLLSAGLVTVDAATVAELPPGGARFGARVTLRLRLALHRLVFPAAVGGGVGVAAAAAEAAATRGGGGAVGRAAAAGMVLRGRQCSCGSSAVSV